LVATAFSCWHTRYEVKDNGAFPYLEVLAVTGSEDGKGWGCQASNREGVPSSEAQWPSLWLVMMMWRNDIVSTCGWARRLFSPQLSPDASCLRRVCVHSARTPSAYDGAAISHTSPLWRWVWYKRPFASISHGQSLHTSTTPIAGVLGSQLTSVTRTWLDQTGWSYDKARSLLIIVISALSVHLVQTNELAENSKRW